MAKKVCHKRFFEILLIYKKIHPIFGVNLAFSEISFIFNANYSDSGKIDGLIVTDSMI